MNRKAMPRNWNSTGWSEDGPVGVRNRMSPKTIVLMPTIFCYRSGRAARVVRM
jgi:hypothetical protein